MITYVNSIRNRMPHAACHTAQHHSDRVIKSFSGKKQATCARARVQVKFGWAHWSPIRYPINCDGSSKMRHQSQFAISLHLPMIYTVWLFNVYYIVVKGATRSTRTALTWTLAVVIREPTPHNNSFPNEAIFTFLYLFTFRISANAWLSASPDRHGWICLHISISTCYKLLLYTDTGHRRI